MPAVVVTGARQAGKSTLAQYLAPGPRRFLSLDDFDVLHLARTDPDALLEGSQPVTLDEVQREPDLVRQESPLRLLLHTGSTIEWLTKDVLAAPWWKVI